MAVAVKQKKSGKSVRVWGSLYFSSVVDAKSKEAFPKLEAKVLEQLNKALAGTNFEVRGLSVDSKE